MRLATHERVQLPAVSLTDTSEKVQTVTKQFVHDLGHFVSHWLFATATCLTAVTCCGLPGGNQEKSVMQLICRGMSGGARPTPRVDRVFKLLICSFLLRSAALCNALPTAEVHNAPCVQLNASSH